MHHRPVGRRTRRPTAIIRVAVVVLTATIGGTLAQAWALDCEGRLVSEGQMPWEVICIKPRDNLLDNRGETEVSFEC
jgi:hypothetical protein